MLEKLVESAKVKFKSSLKYVFIFLFIFLSLSLIRNIIKISQAGKRIEEESRKVSKLEEENTELKKEIGEVSSEDYIEKELRDKLGLTKEGETIMVLPDESVIKSLAPKPEKEEETLPDPNWKRWLKLFL